MASSATWAVLPVKPFDDAKSRLAPVMEDARRRNLARGLMLHALGSLLACDAVNQVLVVSSDRDALDLAAAQGAGTFAESGTGLNQALEQSRHHAIAAGATGLLVLAGDLPLLLPSDLDDMLSASEDSIVIAPDRRRQGTNALLLRPPDAIEFSFGESSYQRHLELAVAAGRQPIEVFRTGLAFDVDLPRDWHDLMSSGWEGLPDMQLVWTRA